MKRLLVVTFSLVLMFSLVVSPSPVHAATYTVTNTNDSGAGSLREAILNANANSGLDTIDFDISGPGPHTIQPTSALPTITDPVVIDGYSQSGASLNTNPTGMGLDTVLMIELDGSSAGTDVNGLTITAASSTVRGLVINRFNIGIILRSSGASGNIVEGNFIGTDVTGTTALGNTYNGILIFIEASNNTIGGVTPSARNVISANGETGVRISSASENVVRGNYIGTDLNGTAALGNGAGIAIVGAPNNTIGGTVAGEGNLISGNGVGVSIADTNGNLVQGNFIGTDVTGTADLGNSGRGVEVRRQGGNTIGGTTAGAGNLISGNDGPGVYITGSGLPGNVVQGNFIGADVTGTAALGNSGNGVSIEAYNATVGGTASGASNTIAFNGGDGVSVLGAFNNAILTNSIFANTGLGIDLTPDGITPHESGDGDTGANNLQNFPILTSATSGSSITIEGTLNSTSDTVFRLEFFSNTASDPTGYGEGENFLGYADVTTDVNGNVSFVATFTDTVPAGQFVTSTATDPNNNTSEFSEYVQVTSAVQPVAATVDFAPNTLNLNSKGKWVTVYIELAESYDVNDILVNTILLNGSVAAAPRPVTIGDYDSDGVPDLMVKFDRSEVQSISSAGNAFEVTVSGELMDGTPFEGTDTIRVIDKGKK